jgi:p-hydroxybenzoate 3-monooxygenase
VVIIGGGPSGLLLAQLLDLRGLESIVIESRAAGYVKARVRAGVIEYGTAQILRDAGVGARMDAEGIVHDGTVIASNGEGFRIDFRELTDKTVMVYGQTELTKDLYQARADRNGAVLDEADDVALHDLDTENPRVTFTRAGDRFEVRARFVAGCDGFHGVSRAAVAPERLRTYELVYPFGWLGILSETPPVHEELIYASHAEGFALCSMRNPMLSRYYVQCPTDDRVEDWSDDRFWNALRHRLPADTAERLVTGPSIEKSIAPLRSFVAEPLRHGSLFLAGDAAHIVPPTGAKGLNLALSDVSILAEAFAAFFADGTSALVDAYSDRALGRVWNAVRFSWWMTTLLHRFPEAAGTIRPHLQRAELRYLMTSRAAQTTLAENYVGLPSTAT